MTRFTALGLTVIFHPIADFIFQGGKIGYKKRGLNKEMLTHLLHHQVLLFFVFLAYFKLGLNFALAIIFSFSSHLLIDNWKIFIGEKLKVKGPEDKLFWKLLGFDQAFHMIALFLIFSLL